MLDQLAAAGQQRQPVRLVQPVVHGVAQQAGVGGDDRGRQQRAARPPGAPPPRCGDGRRQRGAHVVRAALVLRDERDRDPRLGHAEASQGDVARPSATASVNPPYRAAATLSGWPSRAGRQREELVRIDASAPGGGSEQEARHDRGGAAAEPARGRDHAPHLDPPRRRAGLGPATRRPSRKARISRFSSAGSSVARRALAVGVQHDPGLVARTAARRAA